MVSSEAVPKIQPAIVKTSQRYKLRAHESNEWTRIPSGTLFAPIQDWQVFRRMKIPISFIGMKSLIRVPFLQYERIIGYTHRARELAHHQTFPYSCEFV